MKHLKYFYVSIGIVAVGCLLPGCSTQKHDDENHASEVAAASTDNAVVEVSEDKSSLADYYKLDHIKEWYPKRILPPPFNFSVDLSDKTIVELSLLRNEIFARNGYLFNDAVLRGYFNQFDWYQPIFDVPEFKVRLTQQEQDFVNRVLARERELSKGRYVKKGDYGMIDLTHVYNLSQFKAVDNRMKELLARNNFAIVPAAHDQLFHVYDNNHYQYIPSFITTDIYLQVLHKHFSTLLQKIEEQKLAPLLTTLLENLTRKSFEFQNTASDPALKNAAQWSTTYLAIASDLISGTEQITPGMENVFKTETEKITNATGVGSKFLDSDIVQYAQFKPRGNYTTSVERQRYFRCVKWLNTAPMYIGKDERLLSSVLIASFIKRNPANLTLFRRFNNAINFITGDEDNMSISNLIALMSDEEAANPSILNNPARLDALRKKLLDASADKIQARAALKKWENPQFFLQRAGTVLMPRS